MSGEKTLEGMIVHHCAPVLRGIKPGGLFNAPALGARTPSPAEAGEGPVRREASDADLCRALREAQAKLAPLGVFLDTLATRPFGSLVYVYRPAMVSRMLGRAESARFLEGYGYPRTCAVKPHIERMRQRVAETDASPSCAHARRFPHEIGLFLGYPLEDVVGFIENQGRNCLACGCWKVYANERDAQACFGCFRTCTKELRELFSAGVPIEELTRAHAPAQAGRIRPRADEAQASAHEAPSPALP